MTEKQLKNHLGTLILYLESHNVWKKAKLITIFELPEGVKKEKQCALIKTPEGEQIIYTSKIYYAFPHFDKDIEQFHSHLKNNKHHACAAK